MLDPLLHPSSIAVVGASPTPGHAGHDLIANLQAFGFQGEIFPIGLGTDEILGLPCYPDVESCPRTPELAVIAVPATEVVSCVRQAADAGIGAFVVLASGFREAGPDGRTLEESLQEVCRVHGTPLLGPNCVGLVNTWHRMNASLSPAMSGRGGIALISQSGALCMAALDWAATQNVGLSVVVSLGNKAGLDETDLLRALTRDDRTTVIAGFLESVTDGEEFLRAAEQAAEIKPVVVFKAGITQAGARAASSHTGSLAGANIAYGAAFRRAGVIRAQSIDDLFDYALGFAFLPLPKGPNVAVITNGGGPGIMAADALESSGLVVAQLHEATKDKLRTLLPDSAILANPLDVVGDVDPDRFTQACRFLLNDPGVDSVLVLLTPDHTLPALDLAEALAEIADERKPLLTSFMGGRAMDQARLRLTERNMADYPTPERAIGALRALWDHAAWKKRPPRVVTRFPVNHQRIRRVLRWHERMGLHRIAEVEAKEILRAYGFIVPRGGMIHSSDAAVELAERIGYPVVMKIVSPDLVHKSDFDGVRLNLTGPEEVRDTYDLMMLRMRRKAPDAAIRGIYLERMGFQGRETILGMTRDPVFGPMLMFGLGGIFVEVLKDVTFHLAPITAEEAKQMLKSTRSYDLLLGSRGQAAVDLDALALGLQRISQLAMEYPQIFELEINPLIVGDLGVEPYVADARMALRSPDSNERP